MLIKILPQLCLDIDYKLRISSDKVSTVPYNKIWPQRSEISSSPNLYDSNNRHNIFFLLWGFYRPVKRKMNSILQWKRNSKYLEIIIWIFNAFCYKQHYWTLSTFLFKISTIHTFNGNVHLRYYCTKLHQNKNIWKYEILYVCPIYL